MRVLITGITGFVGGYLGAALAQEPDLNLFGVTRHLHRLLPDLQGKVTCLEGDLRSAEFVGELLNHVRPDAVYHLAGQAFVPKGWADPWHTFEANVLPQLNLLQGLVALNLTPRFLSVTSGKAYGYVPPADWPVPEETPLRPDSPYGVSKATEDLMAQQYFYSHNLPVIRVRPFNHIGPRQDANFVTASFARQIALVEAGLSEPVVRVGNLAAQRDFTHVKDVVRAYIMVMKRGGPGEAYNIGSGQAVPVQRILDVLVELSTGEVRVEPDPARMRPVDQPVSYGDIGKILAHVGWQPQITLEDSLRQILDYWREQVARGQA